MKIQHLILTAFTAFFAGNAVAEVIASGDDCGEHCSWKVEDGVLTITGYGDINDYDRDCTGGCHTTAPWLEAVSYIQKLVIENDQDSSGFKRIGQNAFADMAFTEAVLPDGLESIGSKAFLGGKLKTINLPDSIKTIESYAFNDNKIEDLRIPASLTQLDARVFSANPIKELVIPENVTEINAEAFYCPGCDSTLAGRAMPLERIYCSEAQMEQCRAAVSYFGDGVEIFEYKKIGDAIYVNGKFYQNANDIHDRNNIKKRIYTIEEANATVKAIGKDHVTFRIRYK